MSDFFDRLLQRSLVRRSLVRPVLGTRFGSEPLLLEEGYEEGELGGLDLEPTISRIFERRLLPAAEAPERRSTETTGTPPSDEPSTAGAPPTDRPPAQSGPAPDGLADRAATAAPAAPRPSADDAVAADVVQRAADAGPAPAEPRAETDRPDARRARPSRATEPRDEPTPSETTAALPPDEPVDTATTDAAPPADGAPLGDTASPGDTRAMAEDAADRWQEDDGIVAALERLGPAASPRRARRRPAAEETRQAVQKQEEDRLKEPVADGGPAPEPPSVSARPGPESAATALPDESSGAREEAVAAAPRAADSPVSAPEGPQPTTVEAATGAAGEVAPSLPERSPTSIHRRRRRGRRSAAEPVQRRAEPSPGVTETGAAPSPGEVGASEPPPAPRVEPPGGEPTPPGRPRTPEAERAPARPPADDEMTGVPQPARGAGEAEPPADATTAVAAADSPPVVEARPLRRELFQDLAIEPPPAPGERPPEPARPAAGERDAAAGPVEEEAAPQADTEQEIRRPQKATADTGIPAAEEGRPPQLASPVVGPSAADAETTGAAEPFEGPIQRRALADGESPVAAAETTGPDLADRPAATVQGPERGGDAAAADRADEASLLEGEAAPTRTPPEGEAAAIPTPQSAAAEPGEGPLQRREVQPAPRPEAEARAGAPASRPGPDSTAIESTERPAARAGAEQAAPPEGPTRGAAAAHAAAIVEQAAREEGPIQRPTAREPQAPEPHEGPIQRRSVADAAASAETSGRMPPRAGGETAPDGDAVTATEAPRTPPEMGPPSRPPGEAEATGAASPTPETAPAEPFEAPIQRRTLAKEPRTPASTGEIPSTVRPETVGEPTARAVTAAPAEQPSLPPRDDELPAPEVSPVAESAPAEPFEAPIRRRTLATEPRGFESPGAGPPAPHPAAPGRVPHGADDAGGLPIDGSIRQPVAEDVPAGGERAEWPPIDESPAAAPDKRAGQTLLPDEEAATGDALSATEVPPAEPFEGPIQRRTLAAEPRRLESPGAGPPPTRPAVPARAPQGVDDAGGLAATGPIPEPGAEGATADGELPARTGEAPSAAEVAPAELFAGPIQRRSLVDGRIGLEPTEGRPPPPPPIPSPTPDDGEAGRQMADDGASRRRGAEAPVPGPTGPEVSPVDGAAPPEPVLATEAAEVAWRDDRTTPTAPATDGRPPPAVRIPLRRGSSDELSRIRPVARQVTPDRYGPDLTRVELRGPVELGAPRAWDETDLRPADGPTAPADHRPPAPVQPTDRMADAPDLYGDALAALEGHFEPPPLSEPRRRAEADRQGLEIHIGRIEVREPPPPPEAPAPRPFEPRLSLDEYLRQRRAGLR